MSENLTSKLPSDDEMFSQLLDALKDLNTRLDGLEQKLDTLLTIQADFRDLYNRFLGLERKPELVS